MTYTPMPQWLCDEIADFSRARGMAELEAMGYLSAQVSANRQTLDGMAMRPRPVVHLVSCSAAKLTHAAEARNLYCSPWFSKVRLIVDVPENTWFILSAKHGLTRPGQWLAPYDTALQDLNPEEFKTWRRLTLQDVLRELAYLGRKARVKIWAGRRYRKHLAEGLKAAGHFVEVPLAGLGIGQQLQKLTQILEGMLAKPRTCPTCKASFQPRTLKHRYCKPRCGPNFLGEIVTITDEATSLPQSFWDAVNAAKNVVENPPIFLPNSMNSAQDKDVTDSS